jgi:hypothetical protein
MSSSRQNCDKNTSTLVEATFRVLTKMKRREYDTIMGCRPCG